jgi:hypothetical protein
MKIINESVEVGIGDVANAAILTYSVGLTCGWVAAHKRFGMWKLLARMQTRRNSCLDCCDGDRHHTRSLTLK